MGFFEIKKELLKSGKTIRFFYDPENNGTLHIWYVNNIPISFQLSYMDVILEWKGKKEILSGKIEEDKEELKYKGSSIMLLGKLPKEKITMFLENLQNDYSIEDKIKEFIIKKIKEGI